MKLTQLVPWTASAFQPLSAEELEQLESDVGPLPCDYAEFLRSYGASAFDGVAEVVVPTLGPVPIRGLLGSGSDSRSVVNALASCRSEGIEVGMLPIGRDSFGGLFMLRALDGYVLHLNTDLDPDETAEAWQVVAPSFSSFMDSIRVFTE